MSTLQKFKANVKNLARPNRFRVSFPNPPVGVALETNYTYFVRSVGTPEKTIGDITSLFWMGMNYKMGGDPSFNDITLRFMNLENHSLKAGFERWMDLIANTITNTRGEPEAYKTALVIEQLDHTNAVSAKYYCYGVFPKTVTSIELSQTEATEPEEFDVMFSLDYYSDSDAEGKGTGTVSVEIGTGSLSA